MPRKVRITTTSFHIPGPRTVELNRQQACVFLEAAGAEGADLVCLPEIFLKTGVSGEEALYTEPLTGPTYEAASRIARKHRMWVVASYLVRTDGGSIENTAVAIDREGDIAGCYSKIYPTIGECEKGGVRPGSQATVVETDFGRMGLAICYDIGYPEYWAQLQQQGAELVVWPSAYDGGFPLQSYAWTHSYYVVSAVRSEHGKVIDISGNVLASTSRWHRLTTTTIDLEKELFHVAVCLGQHEKIFRLQEEMGGRVTIRGFSEENFVTVESNDPDWPVGRLKEHFGLLNFREYHQRAALVQDEHRQSSLEWAPAQAQEASNVLVPG